MRISVFGLGYVGCVTGVCFADRGFAVTGVDTNPLKVDMVNQGKTPILEKGLQEMLARTVAEGWLSATSDVAAAVEGSDIALVCVGTPSRHNGSIDLTFVRRVCEQIGAALKGRKGYFVVGIRSTVFPGTVEETVIPLLERESGRKAGEGFGVCMIPEFLREGSSVHDFTNPPKTVIGELDPRSGETAAALFDGIDAPLVRVPLRVAEMVKYTDNSFHALKVTFANEIGALCKELKMDSHRVMEIFCLDTKLNLSPYYLKPGFAFGGSCLPKDLREITYESRMHDVETPVLSAILESNHKQILRVVKTLSSYKGRRLGFLGLSFKGGTDDLRESPLVEVIETMIGKGFALRIYDRHVNIARLFGSNRDYIEKEIPHISSLMCHTAEELVRGAEVIVVGNGGDEFREAVVEHVREHQVVIDLVRILGGAGETRGQYHGICW